jgi:hypothetical protein
MAKLVEDVTLEEQYRLSAYYYKCWQDWQQVIQEQIQQNDEETRKKRAEEKRQTKLLSLEKELRKLQDEKKIIDTRILSVVSERSRLLDDDYTEEEEEEEQQYIIIDNDPVLMKATIYSDKSLECPLTRSLLSIIRKKDFKPVFDINNGDWFRMNETDAQYDSLIILLHNHWIFRTITSELVLIKDKRFPENTFGRLSDNDLYSMIIFNRYN